MKKINIIITALAFIILQKENNCFAFTKEKPFKQNDAIQLVKEMGNGWNLGNTFDANGCKGLESETSWGQPYTTKEMIDSLSKSGIKTIRIPVSWANHIIDSKYTIDSKWMSRVKQVVDWAIDDGMYVIINIHHDNYTSNKGLPHCGGYYPDPVNYNESLLFVKNIWKQIAQTFNNSYDEHLIFEVLNEPRLRGHSHEWYYNNGCNECKYGAQTINKLLQVSLDTIRESGGNNKKRFVMVMGIAASPDCELGDKNPFVIPKDYTDSKINNQRLIISAHMYKPYSFAMENPGETIFTDNHKKELSYYFNDLYNTYCLKGYPVIIGEYGAVNKNNINERVKWFEYFNEEAQSKGICCILWDNGDTDASNTFEEKFGYFNRKECNWYFPEIIDALNKK